MTERQTHSHSPTTKRKLPIGIQTFRKMREEKLLLCSIRPPTCGNWWMRGSHFFLSRPRRFGKSLFLDTLKDLFEGNAPLFEGLDIHDHWDWSVRHPVVRLSFGSGNFKEPGLSASECDGATGRGRTVGRREVRVRDCPRAFCLSDPGPCTSVRDSGWWCWSTNTTSRF